MAAWLLLGPVLGAPTRRVLGTSDSEAPGHLWRFAAHLRALPHSGPWIHPYEAGTLHPGEAILTPLSLLLAWPFFALAGGGVAGVTLAWNAQLALALVVGAAGTWAFLREWLGEADPGGVAAAAGSVIVACGAYLQEMPEIGRLETLTHFLYPAHLWLLYRATVSRRGNWDALLAVGSFGLLAMQGGEGQGLIPARLEPKIR